MTEFLIGALSVLVAVGTWAISQRRDRQARRATHTADFLSMLSTNELLADANYRMSCLVQSAVQFDDASIDDDTHKSIQRLLNYYEYISAFYYEGVLDKALVRQLRGGAMARAYRTCLRYIEARRQRLNAPKLYEFLQRFVEEKTEADIRDASAAG